MGTGANTNTTQYWSGLLIHYVSGNKCSPASWQWDSYAQIFVAITGIVGNTLVIGVYLRKLRFHIATNTLILNLAIADLLSSIFFIPVPTLSEVGNTWSAELYCSFVWSWVTLWIAIVASVYTLTLLSVERYLAVVYPLRYRLVFVGARSKFVIAAIWTVSILVNIYIVFIAKSANGICVINWPGTKFQAIFGVVLFLVEFFIPMVIMLVSNMRAISALRKQAETPSRGGTARNSPGIALLRTRRKVIETVLVVVVTFIICWLPDQLFYMLYNLGVLDTTYLSTHAYHVFVLLAFLNSCVNPIIYTFKNKEFRNSLKILLRVRKKNKISAAVLDPVLEN